MKSRLEWYRPRCGFEVTRGVYRYDGPLRRELPPEAEPDPEEDEGLWLVPVSKDDSGDFVEVPRHLYVEFVRIRTKPESDFVRGVVRFADRWGPLWGPTHGPLQGFGLIRYDGRGIQLAERLSDWKSTLRSFSLVHRLHLALAEEDEQELVEIIRGLASGGDGERSWTQAARVFMADLMRNGLDGGCTIDVEALPDGTWKSPFRPRNLYGELWLQLWEAVTNNDGFGECENCGKPFPITSRAKGKGKRFCSNRCRMAAHRAKEANHG